ncbi:MAG: CHAD domain-containing protein [Rubritepida sp.]|nr:CHAD domain-containing protein [Rubritepida sp.]
MLPLPPEDATTLPGWRPEPEPAAAPAEAETLAVFQGRRAILAEGASWLEGRLVAGGRTRRIARLVLEGEAGALLALALPLARDLPLLPARASLAEEALALAEDRAPRPRRGGPPSLGDAADVEGALRVALGHLLEVLLAESAACRLEFGPRGVHQSRVALRRMRSLLRIFRPLVDGPDWRAWDAALRDLAAALGAARDWDVFLDGIGAGTLAALGGDARIKRLMGAARRERDAAYAALEEVLAGPGFRLAVWQGLALILLRPAAAPELPLPPFAAEVLRKRWKRLKRAGAAMEALDPAALHEMRLDAKRLRYAAEPFAALWPGKAARRFTKRLAGLQEALGLANDAVVARDLAARLAGQGAGGFAIGTVTGFAAGRAEGSRLAAMAAWEALRRAGPFWKGEPEGVS